MKDEIAARNKLRSSAFAKYLIIKQKHIKCNHKLRLRQQKCHCKASRQYPAVNAAKGYNLNLCWAINRRHV